MNAAKVAILFLHGYIQEHMNDTGMDDTGNSWLVSSVVKPDTHYFENGDSCIFTPKKPKISNKVDGI